MYFAITTKTKHGNSLFFCLFENKELKYMNSNHYSKIIMAWSTYTLQKLFDNYEKSTKPEVPQSPDARLS